MELLTVRQVSGLTGVSVNTLNQWRSQGLHIPYVKLGKAVRYLRFGNRPWKGQISTIIAGLAGHHGLGIGSFRLSSTLTLSQPSR